MEIVAVIDFETTGLSPVQGDRATEIAAVLLENGKVVDRYQSLMNAGCPHSVVHRGPHGDFRRHDLQAAAAWPR